MLLKYLFFFLQRMQGIHNGIHNVLAALLFNLNIPFCCIILKKITPRNIPRSYETFIFFMCEAQNLLRCFSFYEIGILLFPPFLKVISKSQNNKVAFATLSEWNQCFIGTIPIDMTLLTEVDNQVCGILNRQTLELDWQTNCFAVLLENSGKSHNRSHSSEVSRRTLSVLKVSFPYN